ncbi:hypothetical protein E4U41_004696 [Claviceps citrina]|nr:hypothetical protein E4U41_004696 [Claviceps citrina]
MSNDESTYAPKSPDLSLFYSSDPTQPASQLRPPSPGSDQYKWHPTPSYTYGASNAPPMRFPAIPQQQVQSQTSAPSQQYPSGLSPGPHQLPARNLYYLQAPHFHHSHPVQVYSPPILPQGPQRFQPAYPSEASSAAAQHKSDMPPRKAAAAPPAPVIEPSPVKTKFPTARIKRIMQADEEVGKVAQQTPIAVGKALELFMIQMVSRSAEIAKEKGSKRVTASMLKQVVETDDQWDFLREIVSRVENEKENVKSKSKAESDSDDDSETKKRSRGSGRRKKV